MKVYLNENSNEAMNIDELTEAAGFRDRYDNLIKYDLDRLTGNICDCNGNGEFILFPEDDEACVESGKRYMRCRKCDCVSHL